MFKVLLIVYVIGGGSSITYTSGIEFQEFHSMADCEAVVKEIKALKNDATYKDESVIPLYYDTKCVAMTAVEYESVEYSSGEVDVSTSPPEPRTEKRKQARWND